MVDRRFVAELDAISSLESRPNIMDLTPFEFESLVGNLFTKMGLETRQTRASRDGGVDAIAFDIRPVLGERSSSKRSVTKIQLEWPPFVTSMGR
jgi:restriction system protein